MEKVEEVISSFRAAKAAFALAVKEGRIHPSFGVVGYDLLPTGEILVVAESGDGNVSSPGYATRGFSTGVFI